MSNVLDTQIITIKRGICLKDGILAMYRVTPRLAKYCCVSYAGDKGLSLWYTMGPLVDGYNSAITCGTGLIVCLSGINDDNFLCRSHFLAAVILFSTVP